MKKNYIAFATIVTSVIALGVLKFSKPVQQEKSETDRIREQAMQSVNEARAATARAREEAQRRHADIARQREADRREFDAQMQALRAHKAA